MIDIENMQFIIMSERAISLVWKGEVNEKLLDTLLIAKAEIYKNKQDEIVEIINTYNALLIKYRYIVKNLEEEKEQLREILSSAGNKLSREKKIYHLPVCYDKQFGWDSEEVMKAKNIDEELLIQIHSSSIYTVYFIGFLPGFPYLSGLSEKLFISRKKNPRKKIHRGAVGLGGEQTGIYPTSSPGGWQIIGNCPIPLFNVNWETPTLLKPADRIKFFPVSVKEYEQIQENIKNETYQLKCEVWE